MHRLTIAFLLLTSAAYGGSSLSLRVGDITYENVTLKKEYPRSLFIQHDGGTAFIDRSALNEQQLTELIGSASPTPPTEVAPATELATEESVEESYKRAKALLKEDDDGENWTRAVDMIRRAAEAGHAPAQHDWGMLLVDNFCVKQDVKKAEEFPRKAASAGQWRADFELSKNEKDDQRVSESLKAGVAAGDGTAMVFYIRKLLDGTAEEQTESRSLLEKAFAKGDARAITTAAEMCGFWAREPKTLEKFGMTEQEMHARAVEGLRIGCEQKVLPAYALLARRLADGVGVEKNEEQSEALLAELKRIAGQKIARGSIGARFALIEGLAVFQTSSHHEEILRTATEILDESDYAWHHTVAALAGARAVENKETDKREGLRRALVWLKDRQKEIGGDNLQVFIANYENRLINAQTNGL